MPIRHRFSPAVRSALVPSLLLAALLGLPGCGTRPVAVGMLAEPQPLLNSAAHWQIVARDAAWAVSAYLEEKTGKKGPVAVYMMRNDGSLFADAFLGAMQTEFVDRGHPVALDPRPDVTSVGVDVLIVPRSPGSDPVHTVPGPLTVLASGAAVGTWVADKFPWGISAVLAGLGLDAVRALPDAADTEMVLTVSLEQDGFFTFRTSAVYYVESRNLWHYRPDGDWTMARSFNEVPASAIGYDLGGEPYVIQKGGSRRNR
ncbi:hypothetical protein [Rhodocista pekingensis]|uniref:Lipoprotein n=1 Tax=Rhodocista pekingensis TaxID=201185 RepID=A0ABW2KY00_9PROT